MVSTVSFVVEKHYCGSTLIDAAVFSKADTCGMEMPSDAIKTCCKNEVDIVKGQDELKLNLQDLDIQQKQFVAIFLHSYFDLFENYSKQIIPSQEYAPPNLHYDRQVLYETYLI